MCLGILLFFPYMKWFSIFSLYLLTGTLRPTATEKFADYELGFQMIVFEGDTKPSMTMSKYDFKNNRFLEHYQCDFKSANIE